MKIAVVFGGRSSEHDISIITGVMAVNAASIRHEVIPVYISREGEMISGKGFDRTDTFEGEVKGKKVVFVPGSGGITVGGRLIKLDCVINACHGRSGEDGALSGLLELAAIPYVGSDVRASAVGMDKLLFKQVMDAYGLPVLPYFGVSKHEYANVSYDIEERASGLDFPLIVKPCNLGSSIGIGIANDYRELFVLLDGAFEWDRRAIVEKALTDFVEVNCAVLGYDDLVISSEVEQPVGFDDFLSFDDKYMRSVKAEVRKMPAALPDSMRQKIRALAERVFVAVGCSGIARIDFLVKGEDVYVNEINTVPGSLSEYLFSYSGVTFVELIDRLIEGAIKIKKNKDSLKYSYESTVLSSKNRHK
ncbi:MAG: D-alanine--D-alanine ligase [Clostridiales bacterium]|nr:D-alanine--D-alanine ligase [Clostridiales bacterium]